VIVVAAPVVLEEHPIVSVTWVIEYDIFDQTTCAAYAHELAYVVDHSSSITSTKMIISLEPHSDHVAVEVKV